MIATHSSTPLIYEYDVLWIFHIFIYERCEKRKGNKRNVCMEIHTFVCVCVLLESTTLIVIQSNHIQLKSEFSLQRHTLIAYTKYTYWTRQKSNNTRWMSNTEILAKLTDALIDMRAFIGNFQIGGENQFNFPFVFFLNYCKPFSTPHVHDSTDITLMYMFFLCVSASQYCQSKMCFNMIKDAFRHSNQINKRLTEMRTDINGNWTFS